MRMKIRERKMQLFKNNQNSIISNARCLIEGVDVPVVGMVSFISPKQSEIDIVQAIGRALRNRNDPSKKFENYVNPQSVIWQSVQTDFWKKYLKDLIFEFSNETDSKISKKIISNYENELKNFVQVCPIEMLDKLDHPISLKELKSKSA